MLDMATITIEGKEYILTFPLGQMLKAERLVGKLPPIFSPTTDAEFISSFSIAQLLTLFKLGMATEQPKLKDDELERLFMAYLQEGKSILQQESTLYALLGKALGFFRVEMNLLQETPKTTEQGS